MAKRFTDSDKWKKIWFRKLSPAEKCFWNYLTDNCNHAGIWDVDFETAFHFIGQKLDESKIRLTFQKQFVEIDGGKRWFIIDFIEFQYGKLNPENKAHKNIIPLLNKYNLLDDEGGLKGLPTPLQGDKVMVMDKDKEIDKEMEKGKELPLHPLQLKIKESYPNVSMIKKQLTFEECEKLKEFPIEIIYEILDAMENKRDLQKKYTTVNLTIRNWIKLRNKYENGKRSNGRKTYDYQTGDGVEFEVIE